MADLYLMCGVPGSGKSTFLKNYSKTIENSIIISRDEIRFSIVRPDEAYFSHEGEVLNIFWFKINQALSEGKNVFVDQTSLTKKARKEILQKIFGYDNAYLVWIDTPISTCIQRNELRKGTRAYVPPDVIYQMYDRFVIPSCREGFNKIFRIGGDFS